MLICDNSHSDEKWWKCLKHPPLILLGVRQHTKLWRVPVGLKKVFKTEPRPLVPYASCLIRVCRGLLNVSHVFALLVLHEGRTVAADHAGRTL